MMEPERDKSLYYPWVLYDPNEFYKPWSIQLVPELQIRRSFKNKSHFHVLINVKYISAEDISMKYDKEYLTIEGVYKEKKEQGYECYTSFKNVRRLKLPKGVDMKNVDTWTSKDGFLNILAPIDASPNEDGQVSIYYPCANSKTISDIAKRTLNCVQEFRFEQMFIQLETKDNKGPSAPTQSQPGKTRPPAENAYPSAGNRRPPAGQMYSSTGNMRAPNGNVRAPARNVHSSAGLPTRDYTVHAPAGNTRASAGNNRVAGNMSVYQGQPPRNMYPETEGQAVNMYAAPGNLAPVYATEDEYSSGDAPVLVPRGYVRRGVRANNYNQANYEYEGTRYTQEVYAPDYNNDYENVAPYNTYYVVPRNEYIYAAEMDPNTINE